MQYDILLYICIYIISFLCLSTHFFEISLCIHQETLVRVAVWCFGEYGDLLVSNAGVLDVEDPITVSVHTSKVFLSFPIKCQTGKLVNEISVRCFFSKLIALFDND